MYESFELSFLQDHNMIVEEFSFYQLLPPKMQTELVEYLFSDFLKKFRMFQFCEKGFSTELIIQMYSRRVHTGVDIIWQGLRFKQISFITRGKISLNTRDGLCFFQQEPGTVFGDY